MIQHGLNRGGIVLQGGYILPTHRTRTFTVIEPADRDRPYRFCHLGSLVLLSCLKVSVELRNRNNSGMEETQWHKDIV